MDLVGKDRFGVMSPFGIFPDEGQNPCNLFIGQPIAQRQHDVVIALALDCDFSFQSSEDDSDQTRRIRIKDPFGLSQRRKLAGHALAIGLMAHSAMNPVQSLAFEERVGLLEGLDIGLNLGFCFAGTKDICGKSTAPNSDPEDGTG